MLLIGLTGLGLHCKNEIGILFSNNRIFFKIIQVIRVARHFMLISFSIFSRNHLIFSKKLREEFLSREYVDQDLLNAAKSLIAVHLISNLKNDINGKNKYNQLIRSGHSTDQIITSIAKAWLEESETFELPDINKSIWDNFVFRHIALPLIATLLLTFSILLSLDKAHSEVLIDIFVAPPLVAIFCGVLFFVFYKIFKKR